MPTCDRLDLQTLGSQTVVLFHVCILRRTSDPQYIYIYIYIQSQFAMSQVTRARGITLYTLGDQCKAQSRKL